MAIFFNWLGLAWLICGIGAAIGLQNANVLVGKEGQYFGFVACIVIMSIDLLYRYVISKKAAATAPTPTLKIDVTQHWLFAPHLGGSLMFIPAWATALIANIIITFVF